MHPPNWVGLNCDISRKTC